MVILIFISTSLLLFSEGHGTNDVSYALDATADSSIGDYIYKEHIDLAGGSFSFPDCERIIFAEGAYIKNGKVCLSPNTYEIVGRNGIFDMVELYSNSLRKDQKVSLQELNSRWFGCFGQGDKDETVQLEFALKSAHNLSVPLRIPRGTYITSRALELREGDLLMGDYVGQVGANNQKGQTVIRNISSEGDIITVVGNHVEIKNLMLVCSSNNVNGIHLKNGGIGFNMNNVFIGNTHYAIYSVLEKGKGVSECKWENVVVRSAVRGISFEMNRDKGQYLTYNNFYNTSFLNIKEKGVYMHSRAINSQTFRDCMFANVGYGPAYDESYSSSSVYAFYINNAGKQGSVNVDGGYFEGIYYSKDGKTVRANDSNTAVFWFNNINCSVSNVRFANTRTIVDLKGDDYVQIVNCLDNGYISEKLPKAYLCRKGPNAVIDVRGYNFSNRDKDFIHKGINSKIDHKATISRIRLSDQEVVDTIE